MRTGELTSLYNVLKSPYRRETYTSLQWERRVRMINSYKDLRSARSKEPRLRWAHLMDLAPHPPSVDDCSYTDDVDLENVLVLHQLVTTPTGYCF